MSTATSVFFDSWAKKNEQGIVVKSKNRSKAVVYIPKEPLTAGTHLGERHKKQNLLHVLNVAFIALNVAAILIPGILSAYFGIGIRDESSNNMSPTIHRGDLMVSRLIPVSEVPVGGIVLLYNVNTLKKEAHRVVSQTTTGDSTTLTTVSDSQPNRAEAPYVLRNSTPVSNVRVVVPKFGYASAFLSMTTIKVIGGLLVLAVNLFVASKRRALNGRRVRS